MLPLDLSRHADQLASPDPAAAKAARRELTRLTHAAARPGARAERREMADALLSLARSPRPRPVRAHALYLLGFVGERAHADALGALTADPETGEDARMARERIRRG